MECPSGLQPIASDAKQVARIAPEESTRTGHGVVHMMNPEIVSLLGKMVGGITLHEQSGATTLVRPRMLGHGVLNLYNETLARCLGFHGDIELPSEATAATLGAGGERDSTAPSRARPRPRKHLVYDTDAG